MCSKTVAEAHLKAKKKGQEGLDDHRERICDSVCHEPSEFLMFFFVVLGGMRVNHLEDQHSLH